MSREKDTGSDIECGGCRYYEGARGECRARPPKVVMDPEGYMASKWPGVRRTDWVVHEEKPEHRHGLKASPEPEQRRSE